MTLRHLKVFAKVCEKMSMTAAAQELYISQPAVSQTIRELEEYYQVPLFHRQSNKLHLTGAGEKLLHLTTQLLFWDNEIETTMKGTRINPPLKVGASLVAANRFISELIAAYDKEIHATRIYLQISQSRELERQILSTELDVAFISGSIRSKDIKSIPLISDDFVFICSPQHPLAQKNKISSNTLEIKQSDLYDQKYLVREIGSETRYIFEEKMHHNNIPYEIRGSFRDESGIKVATKNNLGIGLVSLHNLTPEDKKDLLILKVPNLTFSVPLELAYHRDKYLFPEFQKFVDFASEFCGRI